MAICPSCKKLINSLTCCERNMTSSDFDGEEYGKMNVDKYNDREYNCPECLETLFTDEEAAREFLKLF